MDIQRKAFEAYMADRYKSTVDQRVCINSDGDYMAWDMQVAWNVWQAAKAQAVPEWISVEDKLPTKNVKVLLNLVVRRRGKPLSCIGFYSIEPDDEPCFVLDDNFTILKGVTHWMPMPQPVAQEQKG